MSGYRIHYSYQIDDAIAGAVPVPETLGVRGLARHTDGPWERERHRLVLLENDVMLRILRGRLRFLSAALVVALVLSPFLGRTASNLWLMLNDLGVYVVPRQSSIFTFEPTAMNEGSGGGWIYGEDFSTYYWYGERDDGQAIAISKRDARRCPNFHPRDSSTWCSGAIPKPAEGTRR